MTIRQRSVTGEQMSQPRTYAERGKEKRETVAWVVPVRIRNTVRTIARLSNRSESSVASELLESAINGTPANTDTARQEAQ
jgi:hypothetical protein